MKREAGKWDAPPALTAKQTTAALTGGKKNEMEKQEVLARAWIECDPNRQGGEVGSGYYPDDIMADASGDLKDQPRWKWFIPRAASLEAYLDKHGFEVVAKRA